MKPNKVERQRVYLAYRKLFSGQNARVRSKKAIHRIVRAQPISEPLDEQDLKQRTIPILRSLLNDRVFEIEEAAKVDFPGLWAGNSQHEKLSKTLIEGNRASQVPTEPVGPLQSPGAAALSRGRLLETQDYKKPLCLTCADEKYDKNLASSHLNAKPLKFSYKAQHRVLETTQRILETSCYDFTLAWFPSVLGHRAWSCAAALELTKWLYIMNDRIDTLPEACIDEASRAAFKEIRPRLALLRHSVVHRLHLEHGAFLEQIHAALVLTGILRDNSSKSKLQAVYTRLEGIIVKTKHNAEAMQQGVSHELLAMQKQRDELDRKEQQLRASATKQFDVILKEADQSLLGCIDYLLETGRKTGGQPDSSDLYVEESDIESDEDKLQADLA